ncbi:hypothetical protein MBRA_01575 [Methylobacterium brachiatum]|nr:hypothetical protein MBRA_01575 [Methylobacterium brachiatum]
MRDEAASGPKALPRLWPEGGRASETAREGRRPPTLAQPSSHHPKGPTARYKWGLPDHRPLAIAAPDKSHVGPLRLLHILALTYLIFSAPAVRRLSGWRPLRLIDACGRHSLEIFAAGCLAALIGRILYRTFDATWPLQIAVNLTGLALMLGLAKLLDARAVARRR